MNEKSHFGESAFHLAAMNGSKEIVEYLIQRGVDINDLLGTD